MGMIPTTVYLTAEEVQAVELYTCMHALFVSLIHYVFVSFFLSQKSINISNFALSWLECK